MPRKKPDKETGKPAYQFDARSGGSIGMFLGMIPGFGEWQNNLGPLNRVKTYEKHPAAKFQEENETEWMNYCKKFKEQGDNRPFPPYPYSLTYMEELVARNDREGQAEQDRMNQR